MAKEHKYSRGGKRKFNARVRQLKQLFTKSPAIFHREWQKLVTGWLYEIRNRATDWAEGLDVRDIDGPEGLVESGRLQVFGVLDIANTVLDGCGPEIEAEVGARTRSTLESECVKQVALVVDTRLSYMINHAHYVRMKN